MRVKELKEQLNKYKDDDEIIVSIHHKSDYQLHDQEISEQIWREVCEKADNQGYDQLLTNLIADDVDSHASL